MSVIALERYLAPLMPYLKADAVTEVCINRPQEMFVEQAGQFTSHSEPKLEYGWLETMAALIAEFNVKDYPDPLLAGSLPTGERVQVVMNPACEAGKVIFSIRRQNLQDLTLNDMADSGVFASVKKHCQQKGAADEALIRLYRQEDNLAFLKEAIRQKKNILISGGTGTGKTTFLNACVKLIPEHERILTVEDTREVRIEQRNSSHLLFNENEKNISALNIFKACLRLRPDRILLSELRGDEVLPYLRAANSGHPGSLTTVHADTPAGAFRQLMFMLQQARYQAEEEQMLRYIQSVIQVVVQLKRDPNPDRFMYVDDVWFGEALDL